MIVGHYVSEGNIFQQTGFVDFFPDAWSFLSCVDVCWYVSVCWPFGLHSCVCVVWCLPFFCQAHGAWCWTGRCATFHFIISTIIITIISTCETCSLPLWAPTMESKIQTWVKIMVATILSFFYFLFVFGVNLALEIIIDFFHRNFLYWTCYRLFFLLMFITLCLMFILFQTSFSI